MSISCFLDCIYIIITIDANYRTIGITGCINIQESFTRLRELNCRFAKQISRYRLHVIDHSINGIVDLLL